MTFSIEGGVGAGLGFNVKIGSASIEMGYHINPLYIKISPDNDELPLGTESEVGFGISFGSFSGGINFSEHYKPYGGTEEFNEGEPKAFLGIGGGIYFLIGFEFSIGWDLIELKDRLQKIWG